MGYLKEGPPKGKKCGVMSLTQQQPLQPPIKEESLLPASCVRYTQMKGQGSEESQHGFATAAGLFLPRFYSIAQVYS